jgi:hypothetical protein
VCEGGMAPCVLASCAGESGSRVALAVVGVVNPEWSRGRCAALRVIRAWPGGLAPGCVPSPAMC